jgi:hypothetical protein
MNEQNQLTSFRALKAIAQRYQRRWQNNGFGWLRKTLAKQMCSKHYWKKEGF